MGIFGTTRGSVRLRGISWDFVGFCGIPWDSVGFRGISWDSVGFRGILWDSVGFRGIPWDFVGFRGISWDFVVNFSRIPNISLDFVGLHHCRPEWNNARLLRDCGTPGVWWDFVGFRGIPWDFVGFRGISWDFVGLRGYFVDFGKSATNTKTRADNSQERGTGLILP